MLRYAANPAAQPNSSSNVRQRLLCTAEEHSGGGSMPSFRRHRFVSGMAVVMAYLRRQETTSDLCPLESLPSRIPSSARGHASGLSAALRQARSSASAAPPFGLRFPSATDPP
jgi:hypothetical protein